MKKIVSVIIFLIVSGISLAQPRDSFTTIANGSWSDILSWDNGVPPNDQTGNNDDLIITHNITLTGNLDVKSGTNITITGCDTLYVTGNVTFNNGSTITVDSCAVLMIDGNVTNSNNSDAVSINGTIIIGGNYAGGMGSELGGTGSMDIDGTITTTGGTVFGSESDCSVAGTCDNSDGCNLDCGDPLPITLLFFNVNNDEGVVRVEWLTQSEINSSHFEVLVMRDGLSWDLLKTVDGYGNSFSPKFYSIIDKNPSYGLNYYKLIQYDYDGKYEIFNTVSLDYITENEKGMYVWPNPTMIDDDFNVELVGFRNEVILIVVVDPLGHIFYEKAILSVENNIIFVIDSKLTVGTYLIVGSNKHELYRRKLVVK